MLALRDPTGVRKRDGEHGVSLDLCRPRIRQAIDIASSSSPFPEIAQGRTGVTIYRQDLAYPGARVPGPARDPFEATVYDVQNATAGDPLCSSRVAPVLTRRGAS
jgi:hypothetical protein